MLKFKNVEPWIAAGAIVLLALGIAKTQHGYNTYLAEYQKKVWHCHNKGMEYRAVHNRCEKLTVVVPDKVTQMEFEYFE